MTGVARALDVSHAALYHHVANADELYRLVVDDAFGELPVPDAEAWEDVVRQAMDDLYEMMCRLRAVPASFVLVTPRALNWVQQMIARFVAEGFEIRTAMHLTRYIGRVTLEIVRDRAAGMFTEGTPTFNAIDRDHEARGLPRYRPNLAYRRWFDAESVLAMARMWLEHDRALAEGRAPTTSPPPPTPPPAVGSGQR